MGNRFLTFLSNMLTDLNLTDMETCYKVFRREIIQSIQIEEDRFGFEPEVVAKIAAMRCRVYEMGISYRGRTYEEGKKIGLRDGIRAVYCIVRYNAHQANTTIQFFLYLFIGGAAAVVNLAVFLFLRQVGLSQLPAAVSAFAIAAVVNYWLCIMTIFYHRVRWSTGGEVVAYIAVVVLCAGFDAYITMSMIFLGLSDWLSKLIATASTLFVNYAGRRYVVFPAKRRGPWKKSR